MEKSIERGNKRKPSEASGMGHVEPVIVRGMARVPGSDFDRRPSMGGVSYVGPSKMDSRSSSVSAGNGQSKKHKSTGKGQK